MLRRGQRHREERGKDATRHGAHQLLGLRGMALVENAGHGALIALRHMFPAKLLLFPGGDWSQMSTPAAVGVLVDC